MAVTYTVGQREYAKKHRLPLVTLSAMGLEFQGPVSKEEAATILKFMTEVMERRSAWVKKTAGEREGG